MQVRISRNIGAHGGNEWRADPPDRSKHGAVLIYARYFLLRDVRFDVPGPRKTEGWAIGDLVCANEIQSGKGPMFAVPPEFAALDTEAIAELDDGLVWTPFLFKKGVGFFTPEQPRAIASAPLVLLGPGFAAFADAARS